MVERLFGLLMVLCLSAAPCQAFAGYKAKPFSASHAKVFLAYDSHDNITIAAEPYDTPEKVLHVFDRDPSQAGYVTLLVVVSNDGDSEIELNSNEFELTRGRQGSLHPTPADDVIREIFYAKEHTRRPPGGVKVGRERGGNSDKDFLNARADFLSKEFGQKFIPAHSTSYGFVFYETPQLGAALIGAKVYIPKIRIRRSASPNQVGREVLFYEIDLKPAVIGHP